MRVIDSVADLDAVLDAHFTPAASCSFSYPRGAAPLSSSDPALSAGSPASSPASVLPPSASLSCCAELGTLLCLFEDGSTTTRSSKRLQEAKFSNRTYRARFPEPVAFVLSLASRLGKYQKSLPRRNGCPRTTADIEDNARSRSPVFGTEDQSEGQLQIGGLEWLHILLPCNEGRFKCRDKESGGERDHSRRSTASASALTERVWEELRSITHVGGRRLKSGGPLFCFSAQDTLRPLLQRFPQDGMLA